MGFEPRSLLLPAGAAASASASVASRGSLFRNRAAASASASSGGVATSAASQSSLPRLNAHARHATHNHNHNHTHNHNHCYQDVACYGRPWRGFRGGGCGGGLNLAAGILNLCAAGIGNGNGFGGGVSYVPACGDQIVYQGDPCFADPTCFETGFASPFYSTGLSIDTGFAGFSSCAPVAQPVVANGCFPARIGTISLGGSSASAAAAAASGLGGSSASAAAAAASGLGGSSASAAAAAASRRRLV